MLQPVLCVGGREASRMFHAGGYCTGRDTVGRFIVFAALAQHLYPPWHKAFAPRDETDLEPFGREVRRSTRSFQPSTTATAPLAWKRHRFAEGDCDALDLFGTNRTLRKWRDPAAFRPKRLDTWDEDPGGVIMEYIRLSHDGAGTGQDRAAFVMAH